MRQEELSQVLDLWLVGLPWYAEWFFKQLDIVMTFFLPQRLD